MEDDFHGIVFLRLAPVLHCRVHDAGQLQQVLDDLRCNGRGRSRCLGRCCQHCALNHTGKAQGFVSCPAKIHGQDLLSGQHLVGRGCRRFQGGRCLGGGRGSHRVECKGAIKERSRKLACHVLALDLSADIELLRAVSCNDRVAPKHACVRWHDFVTRERHGIHLLMRVLALGRHSGRSCPGVERCPVLEAADVAQQLDVALAELRIVVAGRADFCHGLDLGCCHEASLWMRQSALVVLMTWPARCSSGHWGGVGVMGCGNRKALAACTGRASGRVMSGAGVEPVFDRFDLVVVLVCRVDPLQCVTKLSPRALLLHLIADAKGFVDRVVLGL